MIPVPPPVLEQLARSFGSCAGDLRRFGGGHESSDGVVYAYPHGDGRRLLKVLVLPDENRRLGLACLEERLRFVSYLGRHGAPVTTPLRSHQDHLYETVSQESHLWVGYSMEIVPGRRVPDLTWQPDLFRTWGQTIGMLHRLARGYPSWRAFVDPVTGEEFLTWRREWEGFHGWCQDPEVRASWEEIGQQLSRLPVTREGLGFIHNDPHLHNVVEERGRVTLLDFDVANHHWFVNDIAIACQSMLASVTGGMGAPLRDRGPLVRFLRCFLEGYEREHSLAPEWLDRLDLFIAYRRILLFIVMQGWLGTRRGLRASWRRMILARPEVIGSLRGG